MSYMLITCSVRVDKMIKGEIIFIYDLIAEFYITISPYCPSKQVCGVSIIMLTNIDYSLYNENCMLILTSAKYT